MTYEEVKQYMGNLGWSEISRSGDKTVVNFSLCEINAFPRYGITIRYIGSGKETIELIDSLKMSIKITTGEISFPHPNFDRFQKTFSHYIKLCNHFPPF